jgi:hypothetical protein
MDTELLWLIDLALLGVWLVVKGIERLTKKRNRGKEKNA